MPSKASVAEIGMPPLSLPAAARLPPPRCRCCRSLYLTWFCVRKKKNYCYLVEVFVNSAPARAEKTGGTRSFPVGRHRAFDNRIYVRHVLYDRKMNYFAYTCTRSSQVSPQRATARFTHACANHTSIQSQADKQAENQTHTGRICALAAWFWHTDAKY